MNDGDSPDLLNVVLDGRLALLEDATAGDSESRSLLPVLWESLLVLLRAHAALAVGQRVAIFVGLNQNVELIGSGVCTSIDYRISSKALADIAVQAGETAGQVPLMAKAISSALCYSNRVRMDEDQPTLFSRILVVSASADAADLGTQGMVLTSTAYAAKGSNVPIDVLSLGETPSALLRQVSILTGGKHHDLPPGSRPHPLAETLVPLLLFHFLPGVAVRKQLSSVDDVHNLPAVCACHGLARETAHVCSCCLALYCSGERGICMVCRTRFRQSRDLDPQLRELDLGALT